MQENSIQVKELRLENLHLGVLEEFNRYQETRRVKYVDHNELKTKEDYFIDQWSSEEKTKAVEYLRKCVAAGGIVIGASQGNKIIGFASVENTLFGSKKEYLELTYLHVSREFRDSGIGKKLFEMCCQKAKQKGAKKLYIGAHPSVETQAFYESVSCKLAKEINEEIYSREPRDIQMEFVLL